MKIYAISMIYPCRLLVGFIAMRSALGSPDIFDKEIVIMNTDNNYCLAQKCLGIAILVIKLATAIMHFLSVASNYRCATCPRYAYA